MRDEIQRISKLVAEGKLSPEDAADLIDAFYAADRVEESYAEADAEPTKTSTVPPPPPGEAVGATAEADAEGRRHATSNGGANPRRDPLRGIVESIEKLTKEGRDSAVWQDVSKTARSQAKRGFEAIRSGIEEISKGKVHLGWLFTSESKDVELPLTLPSGKVLKVENFCGSVKIAGGFEVGSAVAKARFKGQTADDARAKAEAYTFVIEESDYMVLIRQPDVSGLHVDLEIQLPGKAPVEVRTEDGNVEITDTGGAVRVSGRTGDIEIRGANGVVEIVGETSDISIEDSATPSLTIENKDGNISGLRVRGNINARTSTGNVTFKSVAGKSIAIEAVSGNIGLDLWEPVSGSLNLRTVSGNASIAVPDGSDCRVSLSTLRGSVSCNLPLVDEAKQDQRITGRLGAGTGTLDVSAVTGNVALSLRDAVAA